MQLKSWEVLKKYGCRGITYPILKYARAKRSDSVGHLPCSIGYDENAKTKHRKMYYIYNDEDIVRFIEEYLRPKDNRRGNWMGKKSGQK